MSHANATLTPAGRLRLAKLVVDEQWSYAHAAERFSVSITTARRWALRYREHGPAGMTDRSSRPHHCPHQLPRRTERRIINRRVTRRWGPARIAYVYLHHAVDDHSRLAYSEILSDERKETAAAFWKRAQQFFARHGITVKAVPTDNGACYRSRLWAKTLGTRIKHRRTRPYRPQTNGKVERFNRTLLEEWAYACAYTSEADRRATYPEWLHHYNHHRGHTSLKGQSPIDRVPNLSGQNS